MKKLFFSTLFCFNFFFLMGQNSLFTVQQISKEFANTNSFELPFFEDWSSGLIETNNWVASSEDWIINNEEGKDAPCVEFQYIPQSQRFYGSELESDFIDATNIEVGQIILQFEVKREDQNTFDNEHLSVEVYDGNYWNRVAHFWKSESFDWDSNSVDITEFAMGLDFKIRFRVHGSSPADSLSWFVDNISVFRICDAPHDLDGFSYWNANDDKGIELNWQSPQSAINDSLNWLHWDNGIYSGLGLTLGGDFSVAIRWDENQLEEYNADTLHSIRFFLADSGFSEIVVKIWTGNNAQYLIFADTLKSPLINAWNEVAIDTLLLLDASLEYWVGYRILGQESGSLPVGIDIGPSVPGYGDMVSLNENIWDVAGSISDNYNWNIQLILIDDDTTSNCAGFNIYRKLDAESDYSLVGFAPNKIVQAEHQYRDSSVENMVEACYKITSLWTNEGDTCISAFAKNIPQTEDYVCVLVSDVQNIIEDDQLIIYPNPASNQLNIITKGGTAIEDVSIYNLTGQKVFQGKLQNNVLDISKLQTGMYVVEVVIGQQKIRQKINVR
ncbi:MAG: hypothetical protein DRI89_10665 [Bacteroidetes bacterium]|nr:MAG: hypothetical protein DRI89_10665 [Bacteroidota bacterium]